MNPSVLRSIYISFLIGLGLAFAGCAIPGSRPTLQEARLGQGQLVADTAVRPGEIRGEIVEIQPNKSQILVRTDDGRQRVLEYDPNTTRVYYHGREYNVRELQAGDVIVFEYRPRGNNDYAELIRIQEPVQARAGTGVARRVPPAPRSDFVEGTVEKIDHDRGVFEVRQPNGGIVTVALPYNARPAEVDTFRRLRRGDYVRLEGQFINRDNFQVLAFSR
jgi:hypothetical protein